MLKLNRCSADDAGTSKPSGSNSEPLTATGGLRVARVSNQSSNCTGCCADSLDWSLRLKSLKLPQCAPTCQLMQPLTEEQL